MIWDWTIRRKPFDPSKGILRDYTPSIQESVFVELSADWVVGFVDGEGCFHVSLNRHDEMTAGYQVLPEFVVVQHERDIQVLHALKRFFDAGVVRRNHGDRHCLRIRKLDALQQVCDFFLTHSLKTKKNIDFKKFRKIVSMMKAKQHLDRDGLLEIIELACSMNSNDRPGLVEIRNELIG